MNIRIGDYQLTSDTYCITVERRYINDKEGSKNQGKEIGTHVGYYATLEQACNGILDNKIKKSEIETVTELKKLIFQSTAEIAQAIKSNQKAI